MQAKPPVRWRGEQSPGDTKPSILNVQPYGPAGPGRGVTLFIPFVEMRAGEETAVGSSSRGLLGKAARRGRVGVYNMSTIISFWRRGDPWTESEPSWNRVWKSRCSPRNSARLYDTARSSSVAAHRVAAITMAWVRASWGRTVASGRACLISSVVGDVNSSAM